MNPHYYGLVEVVFTALVVFGLGAWQLWSLRGNHAEKKKRNDADDGP